MKKQKLLLFILILEIFLMPKCFFAEEIKKEIGITYWNAEVIEQPEYIVTVPSNLVFTKKNYLLNTTVTMFDLNGKIYSGDKSVQVNVSSKNNFKLTQSDDFLSIAYRLVRFDSEGNEQGVTNVANQLGTLSKTQPMINGYARLGSTSVAEKNIGIYEDLLTYTIKPL